MPFRRIRHGRMRHYGAAIVVSGKTVRRSRRGLSDGELLPRSMVVEHDTPFMCFAEKVPETS